jgi:hypothetical protein
VLYKNAETHHFHACRLAGSPVDGFSKTAGTDRRLSDQPAATIGIVTFVLLDEAAIAGKLVSVG